MTEFDFKKNVKIVCTLSKGDKVKTDGFGYKLDGKILIIEDLKLDLGCGSGVMVKVDKYPSYLDSDWLIKL